MNAATELTVIDLFKIYGMLGYVGLVVGGIILGLFFVFGLFVAALGTIVL